MRNLTLNEKTITAGGSEFAVLFGMVGGAFLMFNYLTKGANNKNFYAINQDCAKNLEEYRNLYGDLSFSINRTNTTI